MGLILILLQQFHNQFLNFISTVLQQELLVSDLIGWSCLSVCHSFLIFQKRGFESTNIILSNMTKLILLDSLLQEFTYHMGHVHIPYVLVKELWGRRRLSEGFRTWYHFRLSWNNEDMKQVKVKLVYFWDITATAIRIIKCY